MKREDTQLTTTCNLHNIKYQQCNKTKRFDLDAIMIVFVQNVYKCIVWRINYLCISYEKKNQNETLSFIALISDDYISIYM